MPLISQVLGMIKFRPKAFGYTIEKTVSDNRLAAIGQCLIKSNRSYSEKNKQPFNEFVRQDIFWQGGMEIKQLLTDFGLSL